MDDKKIGLFIKELREKRELSQQQLANELHVSRSLVTKWESGKISLTSFNLKSLSEFFEITTDEILAGTKMSDDNVELIDNAKYKVYDQKNSFKRKYRISFIIIFVLLFCFLFYFFVTFYSSVNIYTVNIDNSNISINNGLLIKTRDKIYLRLEPKLLNKKLTISHINLFYQIDGKKYDILNTSEFSTIAINDFYDSQEYFDFHNFELIKNNLFINVKYKNGDEETLKLRFKKDYVNSKLLFFRHVKKEKSTPVENKLEIEDLVDNIIQNDFEKSLLVNYKNKKYDVNISDDQIYIVYKLNNKKEKIIYEHFSGNSLSKEIGNKLIYSYNINENTCNLGDCKTYDDDY